MLADGSYEAIVVDATDHESGLSLDLAVLTGEHKGEVVTVTAAGLDRDPLDLLAVPATLTVAGGEPTVQLEG